MWAEGMHARPSRREGKGREGKRGTRFMLLQRGLAAQRIQILNSKAVGKQAVSALKQIDDFLFLSLSISTPLDFPFLSLSLSLVFPTLLRFPVHRHRRHHRPGQAMDPFHHLNTAFSNPYHPLLPSSPPHHHYPPPPPLQPPPAADPPERERLPQWSHAETAAFLAIRADLDHSFLSTKRNKALWEAVSARLTAHGGGFARTPDQCKSKWKNLVTRFKGTASDTHAEGGDPHVGAAARGGFPFHDEMRRIFDARVERARALEAKKAKGKDAAARRDPDDDGGGGEGDEGEDEDEEAEVFGDEEEGRADAEARGAGKKRRRKAAAAARTAAAAGGGGIEIGEVEAVLREFMRRQMEMEERWMEAAEARDAERRAREEEWRAAMVALGEERLALVRRWREREDAWRARAEEREERRHQLVAALLAKLGGDTSS
ncbi:trihelix transcription factor GT-3b-like [Hordeum vulgare]|nr:trihelix transcription factor GT-3b-like [Hordeum vulgare subsp. vulgare]XP_044955743.1 trihelix transcription factor GT-3b-like [Hordeum vulgare subsp. vulgare]KAE8793176.1 trihelix transcription factor GT-3b-like [Hordeum vulgare]